MSVSVSVSAYLCRVCGSGRVGVEVCGAGIVGVGVVNVGIGSGLVWKQGPCHPGSPCGRGSVTFLLMKRSLLV